MVLEFHALALKVLLILLDILILFDILDEY